MGRASYCKECYKERYYDKESAKRATYAYRKRNRATYLAQHRLRQFERKSKIKARSDGTVDKLFLEKVYNTENCYWCNNYTEPSERTLEHIIELSSGGLHSKDNITMACKSCNSSRLNRDKGEEVD